MALPPLPKLAATLVTLLLIITIASSSREMPTSLEEVGYSDTEIIIEDGKILLVEPEPEIAKTVIKEVTDEQPRRCIPKGGICSHYPIRCCRPYICKLAAGFVARCG